VRHAWEQQWGYSTLPQHVTHRVIIKTPIYFKRNRRTWCDVISNKIRPKRSSFGVRFGSSKQLAKANFLEAGKHLHTTIGPWALCKVGVRWGSIFFHSENHFQFISPLESVEVRRPRRKTWKLESCFIVEIEVVLLMKWEADTDFHV